MNMVHVSGHIGAEPDFFVFENGKRKVSFSVALSEYRKDSERNEALWIPCLAWDEVCDRLLRCQEKAKLSGRRIIVTGSFVQSKWTDQVSGRKQTKLMVKILLFELLSDASQKPYAEQNFSSNVQREAAIVDVEEFFDGKPLYQPRRRPSGRAKDSG